MLIRDESGDAATEAVLVAPVLILLISVVISFALWFHATGVAQAGAEEGVRAGRLPGGDAAVARSTAERYLSQLGSSAILERTIDVERNDRLTRVLIEGRTSSVVPGLLLPVRAQATAVTETFGAAP